MNIFAKLFSLILVMSALALSEFSQDTWFNNLRTQSWLEPAGKIQILTTTKADAEKLLGKPDQFDFASADFIEYYTRLNGRVTIHFTTTDCKTEGGEEIRKNVVEEMSFRPSKKVPLSGLGLPLLKFKKTTEDDAPSIEIYSNDEYGVRITIQYGEVSGIRFGIPGNHRVACENK